MGPLSVHPPSSLHALAAGDFLSVTITSSKSKLNKVTQKIGQMLKSSTRGKRGPP